MPNIDPVNVTLQDTIRLMNSDSFKDRFVAEYYQLRIRYQKLHAMTVKYEAGKLDFTPSCPLDLLKKQETAMFHYLDIMEVRAELENIDLSEQIFESTGKDE